MQAAAIYPQSTVTEHPSNWEQTCSIDELVISGPSWKINRLLTPVLNELANDQEQRWLTLILPNEQAPETLRWLKSSGISNNKLQVLNLPASKDSIELTRKALASGTSHTVVSWVNQLDKDILKELDKAAKYGQCNGLAIRNR